MDNTTSNIGKLFALNSTANINKQLSDLAHPVPAEVPPLEIDTANILRENARACAGFVNVLYSCKFKNPSGQEGTFYLVAENIGKAFEVANGIAEKHDCVIWELTYLPADVFVVDPIFAKSRVEY